MEIRTLDVITASIRNPYMYKCITLVKMKRTIVLDAMYHDVV